MKDSYSDSRFYNFFFSDMSDRAYNVVIKLFSADETAMPRRKGAFPKQSWEEHPHQ